jgi:endonuclease YncB( thermonuclease family)
MYKGLLFFCARILRGTTPCTILVLFSYSLAFPFTGQVVSVPDGDTIEVLHNHHPERIRLSGIDI